MALTDVEDYVEGVKLMDLWLCGVTLDIEVEKNMCMVYLFWEWGTSAALLRLRRRPTRAFFCRSRGPSLLVCPTVSASIAARTRCLGRDPVRIWQTVAGRCCELTAVPEHVGLCVACRDYCSRTCPYCTGAFLEDELPWGRLWVLVNLRGGRLELLVVKDPCRQRSGKVCAPRSGTGSVEDVEAAYVLQDRCGCDVSCCCSAAAASPHSASRPHLHQERGHEGI